MTNREYERLNRKSAPLPHGEKLYFCLFNRGRDLCAGAVPDPAVSDGGIGPGGCVGSCQHLPDFPKRLLTGLNQYDNIRPKWRERGLWCPSPGFPTPLPPRRWNSKRRADFGAGGQDVYHCGPRFWSMGLLPVCFTAWFWCCSGWADRKGGRDVLYGVVDLGANTIRLSVYRREGDRIQLLFSRKITADWRAMWNRGPLGRGNCLPRG